MRDRLIAARARIAEPENWLQGHFARTATGKAVLPADPKATCFCLVGTLRADDTPDDPAFSSLVAFVTKIILHRFKGRFINAPAFNDHKDTTHAGVLRVLDIAIERAPC
ncbi:hypothetical protein NKJ88_05940 [Mesorhizobium sp. M0016]|uniref:DUF6197 family protein n=1 Tax=Mesorhizobium sp. M0016 TaxID=2956843 RepID=UPI0033384F86